MSLSRKRKYGRSQKRLFRRNLHEGLTHVRSQKKPGLNFGESFASKVILAGVVLTVRALVHSRLQCWRKSVGMRPVSRCRWKPRLIVSLSRRREVQDQHGRQGRAGRTARWSWWHNKMFFFLLLFIAADALPCRCHRPAKTRLNQYCDESHSHSRTHTHTHTPPSYVNTRLCTGVREMDRWNHTMLQRAHRDPFQYFKNTGGRSCSPPGCQEGPHCPLVQEGGTADGTLQMTSSPPTPTG